MELVAVALYGKPCVVCPFHDHIERNEPALTCGTTR